MRLTGRGSARGVSRAVGARAVALQAVGAACVLAVLAACGSTPPDAAPSPAVPLGLDDIPVTALPAGRNGIEAVDVAAAPVAMLDAVDRQATVVATGELDRKLTSQDGQTTSVEHLSFRLEGGQRSFDAHVTWGDFDIDLSRLGDEVWVRGNAAYAGAMGNAAIEQGVCVGPDSPEFAAWTWLDGPHALVAMLMGSAALGTAVIDEAAHQAVFPVGAGGPIVGSLTVALMGEPLPAILEVDDPSGSGRVAFSDWSASTEFVARGCA